jgi:hypothetical protein
VVEDGIALESQRIETLSNLPKPRAGPLTEAIIHPARVMAGHCHAPQSLSRLTTEVQRAEAARQAPADCTPFYVVGQTRMILRPKDKSVVLT